MTDLHNTNRITITCPRCGRPTSFILLRDAIDEEGEFYHCQKCSWVFHYTTLVQRHQAG